MLFFGYVKYGLPTKDKALKTKKNILKLGWEPSFAWNIGRKTQPNFLLWSIEMKFLR